jgi:DNA polymerase-3 subunit epsilon
VLWQLYTRLRELFPEEILFEAIERVTRRPTLPMHLDQSLIDNLPKSPGVYIFYGPENSVLYVGKSVDIKERVLSHFSGDLTSSTEMKISQQITHIEAIQTAGEMGALIMESHLIKKMCPLYNRQLRYAYKILTLQSTVNEAGYNEAQLQLASALDGISLESLLGVFKSKKQAIGYLRKLAKDFYLCEKLLGLEGKKKGSCFGYQLGRCKGACVGKESAPFYNLRLLEAFANTRINPWPFDGAVVISEHDPFTEKTDRFMVDHWCIVGKISEDGSLSRIDASMQMPFDMDVYKILRRFVRDPKNTRKIKVVSSQPQVPSMELW